MVVSLMPRPEPISLGASSLLSSKVSLTEVYCKTGRLATKKSGPTKTSCDIFAVQSSQNFAKCEQHGATFSMGRRLPVRYGANFPFRLPCITEEASP